MASSKIRIRVGAIEVEYEGEHEFVKRDLLVLLQEATKLVSGSVQTPNTKQAHEDSNENAGQQGGAKGHLVGTVAALASKLKVTKGPGLILAAAVKLTLVDKKDSFTRVELLEAMKTATHHMRPNYAHNLKRDLGRMHDKLTEVSSDRFALTAAELERLRAAVA